MKNTLKGINNRLYNTEEYEIYKDRIVEITKSE